MGGGKKRSRKGRRVVSWRYLTGIGPERPRGLAADRARPAVTKRRASRSATGYKGGD